MSNTNTNLQTQTSNALHNAIMETGDKDHPPMLAPGNYNPPYKFKWTEKTVPIAKGCLETTIEGYMENYKNVSQDIRDQLNAEAKVVQIILTWIDNDIYSTVDACPNALNVQFLLQLQPEWQRFVTLVKQSQELKTVPCHKLYDILKQHQNEVNEIRAKRLARTANPLALFSQQKISQQASTRNKGKAIINSPPSTFDDQQPEMVAQDDALSKEKEIDKLMALIFLSFKKIYKPTNNNLKTSYKNQVRAKIRIILQESTEALGMSETKTGKDAAYHKEKMLLCKQEEAGFQLNAEQAKWRDDTVDEPEDQKLEAHYMYMAQIQEVTPDAADNSGPIFDVEPLQTTPENKDHFQLKRKQFFAFNGLEMKSIQTLMHLQHKQINGIALERLLQEFTFSEMENPWIMYYLTVFTNLLNELTRNNLQVTTMQVNVQFLQTTSTEWSRFVTIVKQAEKIDTV
ncbi:hypothetical protein Tco_0629350 [Tanacetum coccineum]|uniref:Uncharacterized protein n=1 Tax=Tanacetum coccineum TaxID=301880 RepID=A0ABQ4WT48_9ASTR